MKKVSLLAASVAFALTGCGGSDGGSNGATPTTQTITGFDGYFNQAVVFDDVDNNGVLDIESDKIFGLTDKNGQIEITGDITGALALQTLTPAGTVQAALANKYPNTYAGKYTIDMDHPAQPMEHELVFRAPASSNVISPITDLVSIEMSNSNVDQETAEEAVSLALGGTAEAPIALYDDFVTGDAADAELHKTAQILTESKAANPTTYEDKATQFAEEADEIVDAIVADPGQDVNDKNLKPVIIDNGTGETFDPVVVTNNKLIVSEDKLDALQNLIPNLKQEGTSETITLDISGLFSDADQKNITVTVEHNVPAASGITISLTGNILTLSASDYLGTYGEFEITLTADDINSDLEKVSSASAILELEIEAANEAPTVNWDEYAAIQAEMQEWDIQQGVDFVQTIDVTNLFEDSDGNVVEFRAGQMSIDGLKVSPAVGSNPILTISGTPTNASKPDASEFFMIYSIDDNGAQSGFVEMLMPQVKEGTPVEPPQPELGFTQAHFDKGGVWQMGSFDYGDGEFAFASLRMEAGQHMLCWASEDDDDSTISRIDWMATFDYQAAEYKANNGNVIGGDDCMPATLNDDGTLEVEGDEPGSVTTISMVYQHITKNNDYQVIMALDEGDTVELFWLDSTEDSTGSIYNTFTYPNPSNRPVGDQYTEYLLTDDATNYNELEPLLDQFDYTVTKTSDFDSETILAEGTYRASSVSVPDEFWTGNWTYEEVPPTGGLSYVGLPEFNDDVNREILRRYFTYRDFGDVQIGVGDNDKDAQWGRNLNDFGFFFIASENKEIIKSIYDAWTK
jgi:hypothetical protein